MEEIQQHIRGVLDDVEDIRDLEITLESILNGTL